jgi:FecR protein
MRLLIFILLASFCIIAKLHAAEAVDDCQCPKLACDAVCETQTDLTFYSEKCASGERVKSCSRPTCVPVSDAPAACGVAKNSDKKREAKTPDRSVASDSTITAMAMAINHEIGRVKFLEPEAWIMSVHGTKTELTVGAEVHEKDRVITGEKGRVQIDFTNGNKLNITSSSEVVISEASDAIPSADQKRMVLDLIKGRIRNKVNVKYDGEQSYYQVRTRSAVAGVRGTEFVASVYDDDKNEVVKIETFEGRVELSDVAHKDKTYVTKNESASYVVDRHLLAANDSGVPVKGELTPVSKMTDEQMLDLNRVTAFDVPIAEPIKVAKTKKVVADQNMPICDSPSAGLNECAWICENNPKGETKCRTDLPHVSCVRRICNANGQWSSPTRLPASYNESCKGEEPVVKSCDY